HKRQMQVDPEVYRRQARAVFRGLDYGDSYAAVAGVANQLEAIKEIGDEFAQQQEFVAAAAVYQAIADALIENFELFDDEGGDLAGVVQECAEGLGACLQALAHSDPSREPILKALFDIY